MSQTLKQALLTLLAEGAVLDASKAHLPELPLWFADLCRPRYKTRLPNVTSELLELLSTGYDFESSIPTLLSLCQLATDPDGFTDEVVGTQLTDIGYDDEEDILPEDEYARLAQEVVSEHVKELVANLDDSVQSDLFGGQRWTPSSGSIATLSRSCHAFLTSSFTKAFKPVSLALRRVTEVKLIQSDVKSFPFALRYLPRLTHLDLSDNGIGLVVEHESLTGFRRLQTLNLAGCTLKAEEIGDEMLPELRTLILDNCRLPRRLSVASRTLQDLLIRDVYSEIELDLSAPELCRLDVSGSNVLELERLLSAIPEVADLNLARLGLSETPVNFPTELISLDISENDLGSEVVEIVAEKCQNLRNLVLAGCGITEVRSNIATLNWLEWLDLRDNDITGLPVALGKLGSLLDLQLDVEKLPELAQAAAAGGISDLRRFLDELGAEPSICREAKVLLVGEGTVGKSSLVAALRGEAFERDRKTTHGIQIRELRHVEDHNDTLTAWDFGGQEVYRVTHPFFFSVDAIYIVCWRPRDGVEQGGVYFWLEAIRHRVGIDHSCVVLVATYADEGRRSRINVEEIEYDYHPAISGMFEVDNESGRGVSELRDHLFTIARGMPQYGDAIPEKWERLRDKIRTIDRGVLTITAFEDLAGDVGLARDAAHACARFFHTLGDILYFDESDGLGAVLVIDPEILTRAVSYVLEDPSTIERCGRISLSALYSLWKASDSILKDNAELFPVLVGLMMRFDIAYGIADGGHLKELLLAEMLPYRRPLDLPWEPGDRPREEQTELRIRYVFRQLPTGVIPWLIVRNFRFLSAWSWRAGALFQNASQGAECLVEEQFDSRSIEITCRGAYPLELFLSLKTDLDQLLASRWPYLGREVDVPCRNRWSEQCSGYFPYDYLVRATQAKRSLVECQRCLTRTAVSELVAGIGAAPMPVDALVNHLDAVRTSVADSRVLLGEVSSSLRYLRSELATAVHDTPTLFTLIPQGWEKKSTVTNSLFKRKFEVQLWCEYPVSPHPQGDAYAVSLRREWLRKALPLIHVTRAILQLVPVVGGLVDAASVATGAKDIGLVSDFVGSISKYLGVPAGEGANPSLGGVGEQADSRLIHEVLMSVDPPPSRFRGLQRVVVPGRPVMWVCPEHAAELTLRDRKVGRSE